MNREAHHTQLKERVAELGASIDDGVEVAIPATVLLHRCGGRTQDDLQLIWDTLGELGFEQPIKPNGERAVPARWMTLRLLKGTPPDEAHDGLQVHLMTHEGPQVVEGEWPDDGLLWVDWDANSLSKAEIEDVLGKLLARDGRKMPPGAVAAMALDLRTADYRPTGRIFRDDASVRTHSCFALNVRELDTDEPLDILADKTGEQEWRLIEFAVGRKFFVTVRFPGERLQSARLIAAAHTPHPIDPVPREELHQALAKRWPRSCACVEAELGSGDIGILVLHHQVDSYRHGLRLIEAWLDQWQLQANDPGLPTERETLTSLQAMLADVASRVAPLARPHHEDPVDGWFPNVSDEREAIHVLNVIQQTLDSIDRLEERIDDAIEALDSIRGDRQQQRFERFAVLIAFPTILTGFFGMNTWLPVNGDSPGQFIGAMAIVVLVTIIAFFAFVSDRPWIERIRFRRHRARARVHAALHHTPKEAVAPPRTTTPVAPREHAGV